MRGEVFAQSAEERIRSRHAAYAVATDDHLFRTWHPRTRPDNLDLDPWVRWAGFDVLDVTGGGPSEDTAVVEFRAYWSAGDDATRQHGELHGRGRLLRYRGQWMYLDTE